MTNTRAASQPRRVPSTVVRAIELSTTAAPLPVDLLSARLSAIRSDHDRFDLLSCWRETYTSWPKKSLLSGESISSGARSQADCRAHGSTVAIEQLRIVKISTGKRDRSVFVDRNWRSSTSIVRESNYSHRERNDAEKKIVILTCVRQTFHFLIIIVSKCK